MARLNVEAAVIARLEAGGIAAFASIPGGERAARPARFCVVCRTGGRSTPLLDYPEVTVDCHAGTPYEASELASEAAGLMWSLVDVPGVRKVSGGSTANYSDVMEGAAGMYRLSFSITTFAG